MSKHQVFIVFLSIISITGCNLLKPQAAPSESLEQTSAEAEATLSDNKTQAISGNLASLLGLGKNVTCTFNNTDQETGISSQGIVYVAGANTGNERFRGDFTLTTDENSMESHVIHKNETNYIWSDTLPQGFMSKDLDFESEATDKLDDSATYEQVNYNQNFDYTCNNWSVDETVFEEPSEVEFVDINAQMEQLQENIMDSTGIDCSACNALSGDAQTQCKQALGC